MSVAPTVRFMVSSPGESGSGTKAPDSKLPFVSRLPYEGNPTPSMAAASMKPRLIITITNSCFRNYASLFTDWGDSCQQESHIFCNGSVTADFGRNSG